MFSVMWSEHCSYKSSRALLRDAAHAGRRRARRAGRERRRGAHRRRPGGRVQARVAQPPIAVEPYQGAATGVGGILRDIVAMGARPVALLDALKFGWPDDEATRRLVRGVVRGVGGYGNCVGVPTVGGELDLRPVVHRQPAGQRDVRRPAAREPHRSGDGARRPARSPCCTARRPGATASAAPRCWPAPASTRARRRCARRVQIGDPFAGKLLIEASLELVERGLVEGLQDLGAAGLTCATSEMADRGGTGMRIDLDAVPRRETGHGAVRGDDQRVAGADAGRGAAGSARARCSRSAAAGRCRPR